MIYIACPPVTECPNPLTLRNEEILRILKLLRVRWGPIFNTIKTTPRFCVSSSSSAILAIYHHDRSFLQVLSQAIEI
jgi:hypothetical protein